MKLYNTLTRKIEEFVPIEEGKVKIYTCGPTVYHFAHIGNLRTYINEDILEKTFSYIGYDVDRVMNITDVGHLESDSDDGEDKMLKGAQRENKTVWEVAQFYTDAFFNDCDKLNIKKPGKVFKATDFINEYIDFIKVLEEKGFTYFANGNVYFDISKVDDYTVLSGMNLDELQVAAREDVSIDINKKNPQDFVLWFTKSKFENQAMKWDSPWGEGYPGWHIECSVISLKNLGNTMDIHCGGVDHIYIHHTNEIAQTEAYTGEKWVNYWWHAEFLTENDGDKMSKSKGEFLTVSLLEEKGFDPLVYRYYVLNSHYRKQLPFSFDSLNQAKAAYEKLKNRVGSLRKMAEDIQDKSVNVDSEYIQNYKKSFIGFITDDLNTANAITSLYDVLKADDLNEVEKLYLIEEFEKVLSLGLLCDVEKQDSVYDEDLLNYINDMIEQRSEAKKSKNFARADEIREELLSKGIQIKDTREGVTWNKI